MGRIQGPIQFVMQRKAMVGSKQRGGHLVPVTGRRGRAAAVVAGGGMVVAASVRVLVQREQWWRPCLVAAGATVTLPGLLFWQPPVALGALADGALLGALVASRRPGPRPNPGKGLGRQARGDLVA